METVKEVKTFEVNIKCPDCETIMRKIPSRYFRNCMTYECHHCNAVHETDTEYPYFIYKYK